MLLCKLGQPVKLSILSTVILTLRRWIKRKIGLFTPFSVDNCVDKLNKSLFTVKWIKKLCKAFELFRQTFYLPETRVYILLICRYAIISYINAKYTFIFTRVYVIIYTIQSGYNTSHSGKFVRLYCLVIWNTPVFPHSSTS